MSFGFGFGFPRRAAAGGAAPSLNFDFTSLTSLPSRITFSRTSNATLTDSNGRVAYAPHNLLTNSEDFEAAAWQKFTATVTSNAAVAPDGTTTADLLTGTAGGQRLQQTFTAGGAINTYSLYVKAPPSGTFTGCSLLLYNSTTVSTVAQAGFTGSTFTNAFVSGGTVTSNIVADGWYRITLTNTAGITAGNSVVVYIYTDNNTGSGTVGSAVYVWGAQLNVANAPVNLLTFSEQFDNAAWAKNVSGSGVAPVVTANAGIAPDGTTTADRAQFNCGGNLTSDRSSLVQSGLTGFILGQSYVGSVWVKANTSGEVGKQLRLTADGILTPVVITIPADWQRFTFSGVCSATTANNFILETRGANTTNQTADVLIWGAQLNTGSTALPYVATTSSIYLPPSYNSTTPKNLLGFTQEFDNGAWAKGAGVSVSANATAAPDGFATADNITFTAGGTTEFVRASVTMTVGTSYVVSVYAKLISGTPGFTLDYGNTGTSSTFTPTFEWQRFSFPFTFSGASSWIDIQATAGGTIAFWGAQLSNSASVDPYVYNPQAAPTSTAYYGPRFDYNPTTLAANGLLIEEQRTNLLLQSQTFDVTWNRGALNTTGTPPWINVAVAPDGTTTADALIPDAVNTVHYLQQSVTRTTGNYTASVYAKPSGYNFVAFQIRDLAGAFKSTEFNVSTGTVVGSSGAVATAITPVGNGWYRCVFTFDAGTGVGAPNDAIFAGSAAGNWNTGFAGDGTSGVLLWGAQLEAGSFATSYIPTVASQVTRAADNASMLGDNFATWFTASQGTFYASTAIVGSAASSTVLAVSAGAIYSTGNGMLLRNSATTTQSGGNVTTTSLSVSAPVGTPVKLAFSYIVTGASNNTMDLAGNGSLATTLTTLDYNGTGTAALIFGALTTGAVQQGNRWIRAVSFYPTKLPNATLQSITA